MGELPASAPFAELSATHARRCLDPAEIQWPLFFYIFPKITLYLKSQVHVCPDTLYHLVSAAGLYNNHAHVVLPQEVLGRKRDQLFERSCYLDLFIFIK